MNIAENNFYLRTPLTNIGGDFDGIHEAGVVAEKPTISGSVASTISAFSAIVFGA
jgi:hypothetical protein